MDKNAVHEVIIFGEMVTIVHRSSARGLTDFILLLFIPYDHLSIATFSEVIKETVIKET